MTKAKYLGIVGIPIKEEENKMSEPKQKEFKKGQKVWHVTKGAQIISQINSHAAEGFPICIKDGADDGDDDLWLTKDGKEWETDLYPMIYTLEEARHLRFVGVPKEPLRFEQKVRWEKHGGFIVPIATEPSEYLDILVGKTMIMTCVEVDSK